MLAGARENHISGLTLDLDLYGVDIGPSSNENVVTDVVAYDSHFAGFQLSGSGNLVDGVTTERGRGGIHVSGNSNRIQNSKFMGQHTVSGADGLRVGGESNHVSGIQSTGNDLGAEVGGRSNVVRTSTFDDNSSGVLSVGADSRIEANTVTRSESWGILLGSTGEQVTGNEVSGNGADGIIFAGSSGRVRDNQVRGNRGMGISVGSGIYGGAHDSRIDANTVEGNIAGGISVVGTGSFSRVDGITIDGNFVSQNLFQAIRIRDADDNRITDNRVVGNFVSSQTGAIDVPGGRGNRVVDNEVAENTADGIMIGARAAATYVAGNRVGLNYEDGIDVRQPGAEVALNTAYRNGDWGIEAVAGVLDGGGNRAWSNGQPAQCLNITCGPGPPTTVTLSPETASNVVDTDHCVTARLSDPDGRAIGDAEIRLEVTGSAAGNSVATVLRTGPDGAAQFCYPGPALGPSTDEIVGYVDTNDNAQRDVGEPADAVEKKWVLPDSSPDCRILVRVRAATANGGRATAHVSADARDGIPSGSVTYSDRSPGLTVSIRSLSVSAVTCDRRARVASVFGNARTAAGDDALYRVDLQEGRGGGNKGTLRMRLATGYDSGEARVVSGALKVR